MDIKILDKDLNFVAMIDDLESVAINRKYADIEKITITINSTKANTEYLVADNYVFVDDKLNKFFRIYNTKKTLKDKGVTIVATGYSIMQMFKQRITIPPTGQDTEKYTTNIETIIKSYINTNCVTSLDVNMNFKEISIASSKNFGTMITDETRYKNLYSEIIRLVAIDDLGVKAVYDTVAKKIVMDIYKGVDRSAINTDGNNPIIFGVGFDNLLEATIEETQINLLDYALVGGDGEGSARTIQIVENGTTGVDRHVFFIDARDIKTNAELITRGKSQLVLPAYYIDAVINPYTQPRYEIDYDLGDIVTVVVDDLQLHTRIMEVTETYQGMTKNLNIVFGKKSVDLASVLNKNNNRLAKLETI